VPGCATTRSGGAGSSLRAALGLVPKPFFLDVDILLSLFSPDIEEARRLYPEFIEEGMRRIGSADLPAAA